MDNRDTIQFPRLVRPKVQVTLWEEPGRPNEEMLRARLTDAAYQAVRWTSGPGQAYIAHAHIYPEVLWLTSGSLTVILPADRRMLELGPGDRIEVPPGVLHAVLAGPDGAVYLAATRAGAG